MSNVKLSVIIPARNEMFLSRTIQDILENIEGDTEIIAVLDGQWAAPPIADYPRVNLIYYSQPIGQRAAINEAARVSTAKYVMKVDAHCSFDRGFDVKMMADMQDGWTMVPIMRNLHAFDWVCEGCGHRKYQGPTPTDCPDCSGQMSRDIVWIAKQSPQSKSYCFDSTPHFQYNGQWNKRPEGKGDLTETMSLQGSCFMMTRQKYFDLGVCDEELGSWGSQGIEVACKTWLSGGRVICNHKTWYAHLFRTQGADFGFPYPLDGHQVERAKNGVRELFFEGKWDKAIISLSWLLEKFWPVNGWSIEDLEAQKARESKQVLKCRHQPAKGIIYYTDNRLDDRIMIAVQRQLEQCRNGHHLVSVSLKPMDFGENITLDLERGYLTMFRQILAGLEASTADVIFLAEHDWLYSSSHFDFVPPKRTMFYYNENSWKVDQSTGQALFYYCKQTAALCAYRELLIEHYRKRVERVEREGWTQRIGFEPGTHSYPRGIDNYRAEAWMSPQPNIDIRHKKNLTRSRWRVEDFRDKRFCQGWTMADSVDGWGVTKGRFEEFLNEVTNQRT